MGEEMWWKDDDISFVEEKEVDHHRWKMHRRPDPQPSIYQLHIRTKDGWNYIFRDIGAGDGFELKQKRRPDNSPSDDRVVPASVARYADGLEHNFETHPVRLNYAKLVVHPSEGIYEYGETVPDTE